MKTTTITILLGFCLLAGLTPRHAFAMIEGQQTIQDFPTIVERGLSDSVNLAKPKNHELSQTKVASRATRSRAGWTEYRSHRIHLASRGGYSNYPSIDMEATAYDPGPISCGPHANGHTYTGMLAGYGVVAVDPRVIPLGTRVYVEGYGEAIAADIGGAIKGNRIDLCYNTYNEAIRFGRHHVRVYLLGR